MLRQGSWEEGGEWDSSWRQPPLTCQIQWVPQGSRAWGARRLWDTVATGPPLPGSEHPGWHYPHSIPWCSSACSRGKSWGFGHGEWGFLKTPPTST